MLGTTTKTYGSGVYRSNRRTKRAVSRRMTECWTSVWGAGDRSADMSTGTVGFRSDCAIRQRPKIARIPSERAPKLSTGRAKNSARPTCGFAAGVRAPVLSRVMPVASLRIGTNRTRGSATFHGDGSQSVAVQNRRGQAKLWPYAARAEFSPYRASSWAPSPRFTSRRWSVPTLALACNAL